MTIGREPHGIEGFPGRFDDGSVCGTCPCFVDQHRRVHSDMEAVDTTSGVIDQVSIGLEHAIDLLSWEQSTINLDRTLVGNEVHLNSTPDFPNIAARRSQQWMRQVLQCWWCCSSANMTLAIA